MDVTVFEESRYKGVDARTGATYDDGPAWRCERCRNAWKKEWTHWWRFCPSCGRKIEKFKSEKADGEG